MPVIGNADPKSLASLRLIRSPKLLPRNPIPTRRRHLRPILPLPNHPRNHLRPTLTRNRNPLSLLRPPTCPPSLLRTARLPIGNDKDEWTITFVSIAVAPGITPRIVTRLLMLRPALPRHLSLRVSPIHRTPQKNPEQPSVLCTN